MAEVEQKDWSEVKQFKDPVYGYIPVSRAYVKNLIDTQMMQRIKGVAQTGLRPVFSSATHDRFSHSLGVYKFGMEMYESLAAKLRAYVEHTCFPKWGLRDSEKRKLLTELDGYLRHWKTLLAIACLLHDIGHPVQSHGFEFLFDDPYLDVEYDQTEPVVISDEMDPEERERICRRVRELELNGEKAPVSKLSKELLEAFRARGDSQSGPPPGNPHERMSAYYILKDEKLGENVEALIRASLEGAGLGNLLTARRARKQINQDFCFIARMIIGWEYPAEKQLSFQRDAFFASIKNCVIHILNGTIDADGIDYLMRNSYAAGYDTSKIDSARLCNAYTVYEEHYVLFPAFSKSALSILEGYMSARNFEPKWLYSHHKVVYADLLTKQLYKYITRYLTDRTMLRQSVRLFLAHASESALVYDEKQDFDTDLLPIGKEPVGLSTNTLHSHMVHWSYPFYTYLLAPCRRYSICSHHFSRTADADMDALFHWMLSELAQYKDADMGKGYRRYERRLKTCVLDGILGDPPAAVSAEKLRTLLAENCLHKMNRDASSLEEDVRNILRAWIQSGDSAVALRAVRQLRRDLPELAEMFRRTRRMGNGSERKLLEYWLEAYEPLLSSTDFEDFVCLLEEYQSRRYRGSLWKSQPEYRLFLKDCAEQLGISADDVHRYMEALIDNGMENHNFSIFDGKAVKDVPELYREQFFYYPSKEWEMRRRQAAILMKSHDSSATVDPKERGAEIAQRWAVRIFAKTGSYDFSRNNLVVKFYRMKAKRFDNIVLLFNKRPVPLKDVFPGYKTESGTFPYFYYKVGSNGEPDKVLRAFREQFVGFCREYRESEVRSETTRVKRTHVFRDVIYGDIEMTEDFYAVVRTREFQRLGRIRQLATADRGFPNATHTRLAHSLGTWHVMQLILDHFKQMYVSNPQLDFSDKDRNCALLAALLHDLGHGPYSHAIETVVGLDHEEMTRAMIQNPDTEVYQAIEAHFGLGAARRVCELLDSTPPTENANGIDLIYRSVISGQLDADRIDYLLRDNNACGMAFGHIDIHQLIASMRLMPDYGGERGRAGYRLCFDVRYLPAIEQFIYARYQMYKNVYHDPQKQLFEQIFERIFRQAFSLLDAMKPDPVFSALKEIKERHEIAVSNYICLDDEAVNTLIKKWAGGDVLKDGVSNPELKAQANVVTLLSQAFLNQRPLFERVDLGSRRRQYDVLARRVGRQLAAGHSTFDELDGDCCAFIYIQGSDYAYQMYTASEKSRKNIVLRNMDDGTTTDYFQQSLFRSAHGSTEHKILETDYCYLFFSEELLREDCKMQNRPDEVGASVKQVIESAKPRKHIEIEKKFYCTEEELKKAKQYLDRQHSEAEKIEKAQTDTYFDWHNDVGAWILSDNHFSFRRRERNGSYIFTVKIPTDSPNYHSPSQFARYEYEYASAQPEITDEVWQFLLDTLDICEKGDFGAALPRDQLKAQLVVCNQRVTYRLESECEICLDTVDYKTAAGEPVGPRNYQIEIELLAEPEDWPKLEEKVITPLVKELDADRLEYTSKSKLEKGMELLQADESGAHPES